MHANATPTRQRPDAIARSAAFLGQATTRPLRQARRPCQSWRLENGRPAAWRHDNRKMGLLDRPRRHLHRHYGSRSRGEDPRPKLLSENRRPMRTPRSKASANCSAWHGAPIRRARRGGGDGHDGGHQCAAGAQGRPRGFAHHQRFPRRAQDRVPGAAGDLRQEDRQAGDALRPRCRGWRARARRRHGGGGARSRRRARRPASRMGRRHPLGGHRSCTPADIRSTSRRWRRSPATSASPRSRSATG